MKFLNYDITSFPNCNNKSFNFPGIICLTMALILFYPIGALGWKSDSAKAPDQVGDFVLGKSIDEFKHRIKKDSRMCIRFQDYLDEVEVTMCAGFKSGLISVANCSNKDEIVRIKLKYMNSSKNFFNKLLKIFKEKFGEPDKWKGDPFGIVLVWKWSFKNEKGENISLILQHNNKDEDLKMGNVVKLANTTRIEQERDCFLKKKQQKITPVRHLPLICQNQVSGITSFHVNPDKKKMKKTDDHLREIAWNGIRCTIPLTFQPASIEKNRLLFEQEGKAVFEVKWQKNCANANPRQIIKKLNQKKISFTLPPKLIEPDFVSINQSRTDTGKFYHIFNDDNTSILKGLSSSFTPYPFTWETGDISAGGIILLCSKCGGTSILQFLESKDAWDKASYSPIDPLQVKNIKSIIHTIIKSFRDHHEDPYAPLTWALFDMQAAIPSRYKLERYRFQPGHFSMTFKHKNTILHLHRFSPASFLLNEKTLGEFMESCFNLTPANFFLVQNNFHRADTIETVEYTRKGYTSKKNAFSYFFQKILKKKALMNLCRAWYLPWKNRILAVTFESIGRVDSTEFNEICNHYNIV